MYDLNPEDFTDEKVINFARSMAAGLRQSGAIRINDAFELPPEQVRRAVEQALIASIINPQVMMGRSKNLLMIRDITLFALRRDTAEIARLRLFDPALSEQSIAEIHRRKG